MARCRFCGMRRHAHVIRRMQERILDAGYAIPKRLRLLAGCQRFR